MKFKYRKQDLWGPMTVNGKYFSVEHLTAWGAILVIYGRHCKWHLVRGSQGCWNTSTLHQIYLRMLQHYWAALQGQKPCVVQSPEHWLLYHPGANEIATSSGLHLDLPVCESWAWGCVVLTRTLVILMNLLFKRHWYDVSTFFIC